MSGLSVRAKLPCRACDTVVAAPAPDHAIARGRAGAGLLAHIAVSKYDDRLPLYRPAEILAREGINLETSTLSGWIGATAAALQPLIDALAAEVMAAWRSTTTPPNTPCAASRSAARIISSSAPTPVAAAMSSLIESAKLNGLNPRLYITDVLDRIADHPARHIDELLPWNWKPAEATRAAA
jgi:hypothetical protein